MLILHSSFFTLPSLLFFLQAFRMQSTVLRIKIITRTIFVIQVFMSYTSPFYIIKSLLFNFSNTRIFVVMFAKQERVLSGTAKMIKKVEVGTQKNPPKPRMTDLGDRH